ncbi:MAG: hypothetical protein DMF72_17170 [Acidobacteria bacterium]|nr:MAG: hypothetical protein DMF72_17170 [Acidobacteriota bacterium]
MHRPASRVARLSRQTFVLSFLTFTLLIQIGSPVFANASLVNPRKSFSGRDEAFLEDLERRSFQYFWEQAGASTGLVLDRTRADGAPADEDHRTVASIAATGFGLTALCIAAERGWVKREAVRDRVRTTVKFFADRALQEHGWFYHWLDVNTGERKWKSEVSSIDTALLVAGALTVRQYFHDDAEIVRLSTAIYERIDFPWMLNGHPTILSMGWRPESGFITSRWDDYSEHLILYLIAIGSPTHPLMPAAWYAWKRNWNYYAGYKYLGKTPLFTYQYPHAWVDFRDRRETKGEHVDYFENSVRASLAHRQFCIDLSKDFPGYGPNVWGISASDSAKGYVAWGGPPRDPAIDGTVVPYAAAGSMMFIPHLSVAALKTMRDKYGRQNYGRYGFADAFNPNNGWIDRDVIGIDLGITLLAAENARRGSVWRWFMKNSEIPRAMDLIGLQKYHKVQHQRLALLRKAA